MATIFFRFFHLYHLLNSLLFNFLPKTILSLLTFSWMQNNTHMPNPKDTKDSQPPPSSLASVPRIESAELRRVFQTFDRNGDGRITKSELNDSLENLGIYIADKDLVAMIEKIDANGDGCVDMGEFGELYQSIMFEKDEEEDMKEAFNVFDEDGDGFITVHELGSVLVSLGLKQGKTVEACKKMIGKVDVDGDGKVNLKEFKQMMRGGGLASLSSS